MGPHEISRLHAEDALALAAAYERNREHLRPWDSVRPPAVLTWRVSKLGSPPSSGPALAAGSAVWLIRCGEIAVGRVALNNIVMAAFSSASVGYWVDAAHTRRSLATRAVEHACAEALHLGLHRVEAGTVVHTGIPDGSATVGFVPFGPLRSTCTPRVRSETNTCSNRSFTTTPESAAHAEPRSFCRYPRPSRSMGEAGHHCRHETHGRAPEPLWPGTVESSR